MNFSELKAEVALLLGNLPSSHPLYSKLGEWVNRALYSIPAKTIGANRGRPDHLFPELVTSWISPITVAGTNYLDEPSDKLAITDVFSFDSDDVPNTATDRSLPMGKISPQHFEVIRRDTGTTGYPRIWTRKGRRIYIWPTPSASTLTYLHVYGLMRESELSGNTDEPRLSEVWHGAVVKWAAYEGALSLNWFDDAEKFKQAALEEIASSTNIAALEDSGETTATQVDGWLTRGDVYGN